jgi:DNA ligase-1
MASPAKRRKKNDFRSSPKTVRSLDHFFGKQIDTKVSELSAAGFLSGPAFENASQKTDCPDGDDIVSADELLARKLQDEWDNQYVGARGIVAQSSPATQLHDPHRVNSAKGAEKGKGQQKGIEEEHSPSPRAIEPAKKAILSLQSAASAEDTISSTIPFDENPLTFEPSRYVPDLKRYWATEGGDASYALLTRCFVLVNSTQSRIKIVDTLVNMLRVIIEGDPESLLPTVCLRFHTRDV